MTSPNDVNDAPAYQFGDWRVEPGLNQLSREGKQRQLEPKTMDVLVHLIEHVNRVVPTDELLEAVWPGRVLEQSTVHRRINALRKALDDDSRDPGYIQTVIKRGYRAIAPVERVFADHSDIRDISQPDTVSSLLRPASEAASSVEVIQRGSRARRLRVGFVALTWVATGAALLLGLGWWYVSSQAELSVPNSSMPTVAVLPFANLSNNPEQQYFSTGISEDLLNALASNPGIIVRPRISSFSPNLAGLDLPAIANRLQVTHILEGSVRRSGQIVRVTAQLA